MKKLHWLLLVLIVLLLIFLRSRFLGIAMERDEGIYTYIGHLILQGKTPYVDFYETRFPGIFYMYAALIAVFGYSIEGVATGILVLCALSVLLLFDTARRLFSVSAGLLAAASFVFLTLAPDISGFTRQSEHIVNFWTLAGVWCMTLALTGSGLRLGKIVLHSKFWLILSGICMCWAMLVKPNAIYLIPAVGVWLLLHDFWAAPRSWKNLIVNGLCYSMGVLGMFAMMCLYIWSKGAWSAFYEFAIVEAGKYADAFDKKEGDAMLSAVYRYLNEHYQGLLFLSYFGLAAIWFSGAELYKKVGLVLLYAAGFATITPGWRFFGHYWLMWMPFVALSIGAAGYALQQIVQKRFKSAVFAAFTPLLPLLVLLFHFVSYKSYYLTPNFNQLLEKTYGVNPFAELKKLGDLLAKRTQKGDKLALVGSEPQLYVYTGNDSPTRHAYFSYLMQDTLKTPQAKVWQREFITDLEREKPRFIVFTRHAVSIYGNPNSDMRFFDWFIPFINANYVRLACADQISDKQVNYVLDPAQAAQYQPKGLFFIDVYERKKE